MTNRSDERDSTDRDRATADSTTEEPETTTAEYERLSNNPYAPDVPRDFERPEKVPVWDDQYLDAVALRLLHYYDLEQDKDVDGERFPMYGQLHVQNERHAVHPALSFGEHYSEEHLFVRREAYPIRSTLESLEELGERLAGLWIEPSEEHYSTDFSFVVVAETIPEDVSSFVTGYRNRTLLKYGYNGHYEINLVVVAPDHQELVQSKTVDVGSAFRTWEPIRRKEPGRLGRFLDWISR